MVAYLEQLTQALKAGTAHVRQGDQQIVLGPAGVVGFSLAASDRGKRQSLTLKLTWRKRNVPAAELDLQIGSEAPADRDADEVERLRPRRPPSRTRPRWSPGRRGTEDPEGETVRTADVYMQRRRAAAERPRRLRRAGLGPYSRARCRTARASRRSTWGRTAFTWWWRGSSTTRTSTSWTGCASGSRWRPGSTTQHQLSDKAQARAVACLERFGQRLREIPLDRVRAVGHQRAAPGGERPRRSCRRPRRRSATRSRSSPATRRRA